MAIGADSVAPIIEPEAVPEVEEVADEPEAVEQATEEQAVEEPAAEEPALVAEAPPAEE